jgi:peptide/nickel transport system ATP-binding protein
MSSHPLLELTNLQIAFQDKILVENVSFELERGGFLGIAGESGSGKTLTCFAIAGLLDPALPPKGAAWFTCRDGKRINLLEATKEEWTQLRRSEISFIFQEPMSALNPVMRCGEQLRECLPDIPKKDQDQRMAELLQSMGLQDTRRILRSYPFQLSGGQRQRLMIAMALANRPALIIADEPTTALDAALKNQITELLTTRCREEGVSVIMVSHDLDLLAGHCQDVMVMQEGKVMEQGNGRQILHEPAHPYTRLLLNCRPRLSRRSYTLPDTQGSESTYAPKQAIEPSSFLLRAKVDSKIFKGGKRPALQGIAVQVAQGETLCILGQSGSGKSTLARILCRLDTEFNGSLETPGAPLGRRPVQMVFQDPFSALNPGMRASSMVTEVLRQRGLSHAEAKLECMRLFDAVRLPEHCREKFPSQLSGGQCQRVSIARSLAAAPKVLILDESVSALDPSVQASVLNLLQQLQRDTGLGYLFITHDLDLAAWMADRVQVLLDGQTDCEGPAGALFKTAPTPYTRELFSYLDRG